MTIDDDKTYKVEEYQKILSKYVKEWNLENRKAEGNPNFYSKFKNYIII